MKATPCETRFPRPDLRPSFPILAAGTGLDGRSRREECTGPRPVRHPRDDAVRVVVRPASESRRAAWRRDSAATAETLLNRGTC